jgi:spectinomycin phosphotransferase
VDARGADAEPADPQEHSMTHSTGPIGTNYRGGMLDRPVNLTEEQVVAALLARWGIETARVAYAPVGYGGFHWTVEEPGGARWFVTADPRVGEEFGWILASYRAAAMLRERGLEFVLPPTPDRYGELRPDIAPAWALAVYPYIDGRNPDYTTGERDRAMELLGRLHAFTPVPEMAYRWEPVNWLELLSPWLDGLGVPWGNGPYGEPARALLDRSAAGVGQLIAHYQRLAAQVVGSDDSYVITHDEPHAGNAILDTAGALHFIDWDATFVAPREMGLRILLHGRHEQPLGLDNRSAIAAYQRAAGPVQPRAYAMELFRAEWALWEIWRYLQRFSRPHQGNADDKARWDGLNRYLPVTQNWPDLGRPR